MLQSHCQDLFFASHEQIRQVFTAFSTLPWGDMINVPLLIKLLETLTYYCSENAVCSDPRFKYRVNTENGGFKPDRFIAQLARFCSRNSSCASGT
jgi:hypothetical protein